MTDPTPVSAACPTCSGRGWTLRDARIQPCACGTFDPPKWVTRGDRPCLVEHYRDPDRPRRAAQGWWCAGHADRFTQMLAELPALHDDLGLMLTTSERRNADQGKAINGAKPSGLNLNERILDARREIHNECIRMVREVAEERAAKMPTVDTVSALASWLLTQVEWMADQDCADETYGYLATLTADCRRLAYPTGVHRIEIGPCDEGDCPGTLVTVTSRTADLLPERIWCDDCGRIIPTSQWRKLLGRITGTDADVTLTVAQAADLYAVPYRTLARWVSDGKITNVADGYPARIQASAVEAMMHEMGVLRDSA